MSVDRLVELAADLTEDQWMEFWTKLSRRGVDFKHLSPRNAFEKADKVGGNAFLRGIASRDSKYAYHYALYIDKGPHEVTRRGASCDAFYALEYAKDVDKGPHDLTREAMRDSPEKALQYAIQVDKGPHDLTRTAACMRYLYGSRYFEVEGRYHPETWALVKNSPLEARYRSICGLPEGVE